MLTKVLAIQLLTKKLFEVNLRKYSNVAFLDTFELDENFMNVSKFICYSLTIICLIWTFILNKTLVFALFKKKCHMEWNVYPKAFYYNQI